MATKFFLLLLRYLLPLATRNFCLVTKTSHSCIHSVNWSLSVSLSYRQIAYSSSGLYLGQICVSSCLFVCFSTLDIDLYTISSQMVAMDNSTSCLWWALRVFASKSNISSILNSVVAPGNKKIYFLCAMGTICVILLYFLFVSHIGFSCCP